MSDTPLPGPESPVTEPSYANLPDSNPPVSNLPVSNPSVSNPPVSNPSVSNPPVSNPPVSNPYAALLPVAHQQAAALTPEETWWPWQGHRVHLARARRPDAPARVLVVHGVGGHSGALWPMAALLADRGLDVAAVDLPLYGRTVSPRPESVRYEHWVSLLTDLLAAEADGRPCLLLGASMGGLLACEAAARSAASTPSPVAAVAATCLLDPLDRRTLARMTRFGPLGLLAAPASRLARGRLTELMIPLRWVARLSKMSRSQELSHLCSTDPLGGGAKVPLGFLTSYLRYRHTVIAEPASIGVPVTLAHPARDAWTPAELSLRVLSRIAAHSGAPTDVVLLQECGHFPIEEPGLTQLIDTVAARAVDVAAGRTDRPCPTDGPLT